MVGYVRLSREVAEWEYFKDPNTMLVLIYLMLHARYEDGEFQGYQLHTDNVIYSIKGISNATGLSERQVRTALEKIKATGILTSKATSKFSVGSLEKWASQKPLARKATGKTTSTSTTYNNKEKEEEKYNLKKGLTLHR